MSPSLRLRRISRDRLTDLKTLAVTFVFFLAFFWRVFLMGDLPLIRDPLPPPTRSSGFAWDDAQRIVAVDTLLFSAIRFCHAQLGPAIRYWAYRAAGHWAERSMCSTVWFSPRFLSPRAHSWSSGSRRPGGIELHYGGMMAESSRRDAPKRSLWLPLSDRDRTRAHERFILALGRGQLRSDVGVARESSGVLSLGRCSRVCLFRRP